MNFFLFEGLDTSCTEIKIVVHFVDVAFRSSWGESTETNAKQEDYWTYEIYLSWYVCTNIKCLLCMID